MTAMQSMSITVYDGRELVAVVEQRRDGWHVIVDNRPIGVCADRKTALRLVNSTTTSQHKELQS